MAGTSGEALKLVFLLLFVELIGGQSPRQPPCGSSATGVSRMAYIMKA